MDRGRAVVIAIGALVALAIIGFFTVLPTWYDRHVNQLVANPPPPATGAASALHQRLDVVDLHADPLLWKRNLLKPHSYGHIDLPRLEQGRVALQVFSSVTKTPRGLNYDRNRADSDNITTLAIAQLQPTRTWDSLLQRSLFHAEKLHRFAEKSDGRLRVIRTVQDLDALLADRAAGKTVSGGLLSIEGLHNLEGKFENLARLRDAGYRMASPTHFFDNEVSGSVAGLEKGGLTSLGRQVIRDMQRSGMVVDLAHASHATIAEVLQMATRPVIFSHGGVKATCDNNRNLTDDEIRGIAATGGVIGIGFWDAAICDTSVEGIVRAMLHVRDVAGVDHVALGSDWDGAVTTVFDAAHVSALTEGLMRAGLSEEDIAKIMGGNAFRVLRATLPQE